MLTCVQALILRLVDEFSAVTAITVTTLRKAGTLAASFALFPKPIGLGHPVGAALVLCSAFVKAGVGCRRRSAQSASAPSPLGCRRAAAATLWRLLWAVELAALGHPGVSCPGTVVVSNPPYT